MDNNVIALIIGGVCIIAVLVYYTVSGRRKAAKREYERIVKSFGNVPDNEYLYEKYESISNYYYSTYEQLVSSGDYCNVDDITWHDLDMDRIFLNINNTQSSIGEEYLYRLLRTPSIKPDIVRERSRLISFFSDNEDIRIDISRKLASAGKLLKISVYEYVNRLNNISDESNSGHFLKLFLFIAAFASIFINPAIGVTGTIIMFFVNVITYFKRKGEIEKYYSVVAYMLRTIDTAKDIAGIKAAELEDYSRRLDELSQKYGSILKGGRMIVSKSNSGDIIETLMDYLRMASHIDLIRFNRMLIKMRSSSEDFFEIYELLGLYDSMIAIASYRKLMKEWCEPELSAQFKGLSAEQLYHPLIQNPVKNDFNDDKSVLLTGSNASGKSTFIKTLAINSILAQSIYTVMAQSYKAAFYHCMTSMALSDNLSEGESYYIVEIKSLKRICDALNDKVPLLVFIDEVLRGTNTLERISASSQILKYVSQRNCMMFAATHDIEMTSILKDYFRLYHFEENVSDNKVLFDYKLKKGPATTRNAIKLLDMLGFEKTIIVNATAQADYFITNNEWKLKQ